MFGTRRKKVKRNQIPQNKDSLWLYDNYEDITKHFFDKSVVTEAIYDETTRDIVMFTLKNNGVIK